MQSIYRLIILLGIILPAAAQVGTWEKVSTLTELRAILPMENKLIAASDGGLLVLDTETGLFGYGLNDRFTQNLDIKTVYLDSDELLWMGSQSPGPLVEVLDLRRNAFLDVEFVDLNEIHSFVQVGDSVYAAYRDGLEGGLLLYRKGPEVIEYLDIFNNFPGSTSLALGQAADIGHTGNRLYFRTDHVILWAETDGRNLKDPVNWNVAPLPGASQPIVAMIESGDSLLIASGKTIYTYNFTGFSPVFTSSETLVDLLPPSIGDSRIGMATEAGLSFLEMGSGIEEQVLTLDGITDMAAAGDKIWLSSEEDFLSVLGTQGYENFSANRPLDHEFNRMLINADGNLVAGAKGGISLFDSRGWRTIRAGDQNSDFNADVYDWDQMITDTLDFKGNAVVEDMILDQDGNTYFSIQGRGLFRLDANPPGESAFFTSADGSLEPTYDSESYILPGQMATDSRGNLWVTTKFVREGGKVVSIVTPENEVLHLSQFQGGLDSRTVKSIAIDSRDRVWLGSQVRTEIQAGGGIHFVEIVDGELGPDMSVNVSSLQMLGTPLASNEILQLEVDAANTLWILTPSGVQSMQLPDRWLNTSELRNHANIYMTKKESDFYHYWQLTDYNVTAIEIDSRGNRWFLSSNSGLHVLQENGRWINGGYGYNTSNSGLLDNEVYAAAFDGTTGRAYFSTPKGISVLNTPFAQSKESYSVLHIYPQPFNPDIHDRVIIQGLMDNSTVRILTIRGELVRELSYLDNDVQGYEAQWDGRDSAGDKVGSGVYLLFFFNDEGEASSAKLAVLR